MGNSPTWLPRHRETLRMTGPFNDLKANHYGAIVADPPWAYSVFSDKGKDRSAERHYETQDLNWICNLPVADLARKDCHLFLWITGPCIVRGDHIKVMEAWGFKPSAMAFVWLKAKIGAFNQSDAFFRADASAFVKGMGHTTRQNAEYVVLGRKGSPRRHTKAMHQLIVEPRREHSRKPEVFRDCVEEYVGAGTPIAELFARQTRPGWDTWGNQATKFDEAVA